MTAVLLRSQVFSDATLCHGVCGSQHSFETLGTAHSVTQHHFPEDQKAHDKCAIFLRCHIPVQRCDIEVKQ